MTIGYHNTRQIQIPQHLMKVILERQESLFDDSAVTAILARHEKLHTSLLRGFGHSWLCCDASSGECAYDYFDAFESFLNARFGGVVYGDEGYSRWDFSV